MENLAQTQLLKIISILLIIGVSRVDAQTSSATTTTIGENIKKYDLTSFNVGYGVVVIAIGMIISAILCIMGRGTRFPE
jgi:hypothetical protein